MKSEEFEIKEDGTIKFIDKTKSKGKYKKSSMIGNGCFTEFITFVVFILFTSFMGGFLGYFSDNKEGVELGVFIGAIFGFCYGLIELLIPSKK